MPTYATQAQATAYIDGLVVDDEARFALLLERAERDVDNLLGPWGAHPDTGLKVDPTRLDTHQAAALSRAVSAQVEYLLSLPAGADVAATRQATKVTGPDFTLEYEDAGAPPARYGPKVAFELAPLAPLIRPRGVRARP